MIENKKDLSGYVCGVKYCSAPVKEDGQKGVVCSLGHQSWFCSKPLISKRKIVQIAMGVYRDVAIQTALCNDGTVWTNGINGGWCQLEPIPQESEEL